MAKIERVGLLFSGGPAPGANAVIAAAASAFRRSGSEVIGILQGYTHLETFKPQHAALHEGTHYRVISDADLRGLRNARGVFLGTARANPGREVNAPQDLDDPVKSAGLAATCEALRALELDALVSIGGDGTLRTANLLYEYQRRLPESAPRVRIVHVPKTIDNDYAGIDFTFGFFTAVDVMAKSLLNLRADALATQSYYVVSTMGRRAGWLAYGVAIAGEAHLVLGMEDAQGPLLDADGKLDLDKLSELIVELVAARAARGKRYGVVLLAEGLAELLAAKELEGAGRDAYGHVSFGTFDLSRVVSARAAQRYRDKTGRSIKITGVQLGYESRCAAPHAFDVLLGTQLGFGAFRALSEEDLDGHMVSVAGQLDLHYVAFEKLVDPKTLTPVVRYIDRSSDFYRLARQLGTRVGGFR
ncbi:MAG TPA: 6-phosphofructokinase [Polyangiales bacterium]|nr:6-phosphofructokinase [Polyangiales bacterium]